MIWFRFTGRVSYAAPLHRWGIHKKKALKFTEADYFCLKSDEWLGKEYSPAYHKLYIYELFKDFQYVVPQGSPMSGIGNPYQIQSISNCFVIDSPHDSYAGILHTDQEQVQIMKRRGGVGFDISNIRTRISGSSIGEGKIFQNTDVL